MPSKSLSVNRWLGVAFVLGALGTEISDTDMGDAVRNESILVDATGEWGVGIAMAMGVGCA